MPRSLALEVFCLRRVSVSTSQPRLHLAVLTFDVIPPPTLPFTISIRGPTICCFVFFLPPLLACIVAHDSVSNSGSEAAKLSGLE